MALAVLGCWLVCSVARADDPEFTESRDFLHVVIAGKPYRLDSLVVKATGAKGPLPIALFTSGTGNSLAEVRGETPEHYALQARDLALRGWLAVVVIRRGIGKSDGSLAKDRCGKLHVESDLNGAADDLQAAIDVVKKRPDVDPSRIIAIGASTGGASVVALGARNLPGLVGVVSFSGGIHFTCQGWDDKLVEAYKKYGAASRVPNLWLYARNDSVFEPELAERLQIAFLHGGADLTFRELAPVGREGHFLFVAGSRTWLAEYDDFLRRHNLPTWGYSDVSALLKRLGLGEDEAPVAADYLGEPVPKAMAFSPGARRVFAESGGPHDLAANRDLAMFRCKLANNDCRIVMENDRWVGPLTQ
ncbi:dienelactone hydrolase family protein [Mesorhizobium comanense]|uniref:dienelactone hydrolase family protein n=1 Tax=Mesorhizobium comanense TaxID=2502215 RepID=UPI0014854E34|nr:dienelactone hydrolase family protein [Mesorhizobium comanense]